MEKQKSKAAVVFLTLILFSQIVYAYEDCVFDWGDVGVGYLGCETANLRESLSDSINGLRDSLNNTLQTLSNTLTSLPETAFNYVWNKFTGVLDGIGLTSNIRDSILNGIWLLIQILIGLILFLIGLLIFFILGFPALSVLFTLFLQMVFVIMAFGSKGKKPLDQIGYFFMLNLKWFKFWLWDISFGLLFWTYKTVYSVLSLIRGGGTTGT
jgi:hypothetical protein